MDEAIASFAKRKIYLGTSSWKYPGWTGLVYRKVYKTEKEFNEATLAEYAEQYPAVGVDHTYYAWPTETTFEKYFAKTPQTFLFGLKATEKTTVFKYPNLKRYGKDTGMINPLFLDADAFKENFLKPLEKFKSQLTPVMFEFSQFYPGMVGRGSEFTEKLEKFFEKLQDVQGFQFAVEIRNHTWLRKPYFEMLARNRVSHVYNSWTRMPSIGEQLKLTEGQSFPALLCRVLLQPGTRYEQAVEAFSPYNQVQELHPEIRSDVALLIQRAIGMGVPAYVFVNNRCEGCAPQTIQGILEHFKRHRSED